MEAAESLSLLPADLVPVFCHRDPLLLGLVIRLWQHSRKDKQPLHQLHQEPWPHTEHLLIFIYECPPSVLWTCALPANTGPQLKTPIREEATHGDQGGFLKLHFYKTAFKMNAFKL